ncbi:MAG TPA: hypothetical protein VKD69_05555 [Vicinamibacterales bacterium]|nr:hypothetical protein [Vicinamibacterales bacterium]
MNRTRSLTAIAAAALSLCASPARADVRADEKSRVQLAGVLGGVMNIFGGKAAREGVTSTVIVKGDRKATLHDDNGQIIDLAEEKIYDLDLKKKTYKVTTFAELRRRFEDEQRKAAEQARREDKSAKDQPAQRDPNAKEVEIDFDIKNTGQKKTINGFDTQQQVMTITVREKGKTLEQSGGLVLTNDMWIAQEIKAMKEVADFDLRYAQKLYGGLAAGISAEQMAAAMAMYPMMKDALGKMSAEGAKLQGAPIQTVMTMDAVKSAEQMQQDAKSGSSAQSESESRPQGGVSGAIGGLLARRMKRNSEENKENASGDKSRATFMTTTHEVLKVGTDVSAADVAIPAGFKEAR